MPASVVLKTCQQVFFLANNVDAFKEENAKSNIVADNISLASEQIPVLTGLHTLTLCIAESVASQSRNGNMLPTV